MKKIPTAEEFIETCGASLPKDYYLRKKLLATIKDFCLLHVQAALETAADNAKVETKYVGRDWGFTGGEVYNHTVKRESIIESYPLTNIK